MTLEILCRHLLCPVYYRNMIYQLEGGESRTPLYKWHSTGGIRHYNQYRHTNRADDKLTNMVNVDTVCDKCCLVSDYLISGRLTGTTFCNQ